MKIKFQVLETLEYTLVLLIMVITISTLSCNSENDIDENISKYYRLVLKAENDIVCNKYEDALDAYVSAFKYKKHPFSIDLYNACKVANIVKSCTHIEEWSVRLVRDKGLSLSWFSEDWFCGEIQYKEFIRGYNGWLRQYTIQIDSSKHAYFRQIQFDDQKYRHAADRYTVYADSNARYDRINANRIYNYIAEHGYPSEEEIGLRPLNMSPGFTHWLNIPLLHYVQQTTKYKFKNIMGLLHAELLKGNIHADYFELLYNIDAYYHNHPNYHRGDSIQPISLSHAQDGAVITSFPGDGDYYAKIDSSNLGQIDTMRKALFLENSFDKYRKSRHSILSNPHEFRLSKNNVSTIHLSNPTEEQISIATKALNLVPIREYEMYFNCN